MEFRMALMEDLPAIKSVYKDIGNLLVENNIRMWDDIYPFEFFAEDIDIGRLYICLENGIILGGFALCEDSDGETHVEWENTSSKALYLYRLGVNADFLRQGIATKLVDYAIELTRSKNAEYLRLFVVDDNEISMKLYENLCFKRAGGFFHEIVEDGKEFIEFGYEIKV